MIKKVLIILLFLFSMFTNALDLEKCPKIINSNGKCIFIDKQSVYIEIKGNKGPYIIFEAGRGDTHETWGKVINSVSSFAHTLTYDRTNLGKTQADLNLSEPVTAKYVAQKLKQILEKEKISPPYILVGHSDGGLYVQMFARLYPNLTKAVVLVDSASQYQIITGPMPFESSPYYLEALGFDISKNQLLKAAKFPKIPLIVITASYHGSNNPNEKNHLLENGKPISINSENLQLYWEDLQNKLATLSPFSTHIYAYKSDHYIQKMRPDIIIDAIYTLTKK